MFVSFRELLEFLLTLMPEINFDKSDKKNTILDFFFLKPTQSLVKSVLEI